ncbi:GreA/GreB family elongation factor [Azospirillum sp. Marseille-Q6669]
MTEGADRPLIWIGRTDYGRLLRAMGRLAVQAPDVSALLSRELDRAIVRREGDLPRTIVGMGSRVLFLRDDDMPCERGKPVHPDQSAIEGQISLASPLGVALPGLREGARMPYSDADATMRWLSVERVLPA